MGMPIVRMTLLFHPPPLVPLVCAGCMSALEAERFLEVEGEVEEEGQHAAAANGAGVEAAPAAEAKLEPVLA